MTFRPIHFKDHLYFVTGTIIRWTPIFTKNVYRNIVIDSLNWHINSQRMKLFAYVIMSNHLHWISLPIPPNTINDNLWSFSSYTAHEVLRTARINNDQRYLRLFSKYANDGKAHKIWKNFQAKNIFNHEFLQQKMEYIHNNPLQKYDLQQRAEYEYSSAKYYDEGQESIIQIEDIFEYVDNL